MKAIVVYPVWAWAIVHGHKPVENRRWHTKHRGPLLIQAAIETCDTRKVDQNARAVLAGMNIAVPDDVNTGAIVGMVHLDDSCDLSPASTSADERLSNPFAIGPVCFLLSEPVVFHRPVPARGQQKIFTVDSAAVRVELARLGVVL